MLTVTNDTIAELRDGRYRHEIPDFYTLKNIVENNAWHLSQPVLDHSLVSAEKLLEIMSSNTLLSGMRSSFDSYLAQDIDGVSKSELFKIAVLLHDIGKITTLDVHADGTTWCPGHAEVGAGLVPRYMSLFGLTHTQETYISQIVRFHMVPFEQLGAALDDGDVASHLAEIARQLPGGYPELLVLAYADMSGCVLPAETVGNYQARVSIIKRALKDILSS